MYKLLMSKFSQDFTHQKSLQSVNFWYSYLKNKKVDVFLGTQCTNMPAGQNDVITERSGV